MNKLLAAVTVLVVLVPLQATAGPINLLTNPGFESGDFTGWVVGGNSVQVGVDTDGTVIPNADVPFLPNFVNVRSGTYAGHALIKDGNDPVERIILSQTVSVLPNNNVDVGFWLGNDSASEFGINIDDDHLQIFIDGVGLLPDGSVNGGIIGSSPDDFQLFVGSFNTGSRTSITVDFAINGSGTSRVGASFDDFFFVSDLLPCFETVSEDITCHADGTTFTVNIEGLNACTGGTSMFTFTASGGAVGEEMCFTLLVNDGGFCCTTEICVTIPDCTPAALPSDLDGDGIVGMVDFLALLAAWGSCFDCGACPADSDSDCSVGILDLLVLLGNWGP